MSSQSFGGVLEEDELECVDTKIDKKRREREIWIGHKSGDSVNVF